MKSLSQISETLERNTPAVPSVALSASSQDKMVRQTTSETQELVHKKRAGKALEDFQETSLALSADVALALALEIDDLPTHQSGFRQGMQRAFLRTLQTATQRSERVVVFNDAIPGFTLMLFKKAQQMFDEPIEWSVTGEDDSPEAQAASVLAGQFFQRTKHRVLTIENEDVLFVFFPVADLRRNLKEMGFYQV